MNTLIQAFLLLAVLALAWYFFAHRKAARTKASVKMLFVVFIIGFIWAVLRPDDLTILANWLGVDRGTDLLLYGLVVAFLMATLSTWVRFREQEVRYAQLARAIAISNAVKPEDNYSR
ncbi:DUF2304 domain-containing protein [Corynebacterium caspium]|uniref:DUF2304 domain-containing protein n=1 Tax=Corynebacterium caspium TaxID=234828 RepID=UPI000364E895|nr:DUF2304 domain-containing protein [Corynebacterium caspium]WKD59943.1 hypothetical protein CCASP_07840 [Corynebacterium caspium DSM 44850]